ncbi:MarR family winged helix-turn-helix transcriptional regulator [Massilia sp. CF038]|uniref:MarR family winged helix-turn-helix transcriptional regulator n=1 Tax=Massilia sp. CF038 TaxID=1881045 RepID=UPI00090FC71D|nr:MarR family transcriptional regulator [Massilia sp. CF038]SHH30049.1 DNA-binding transcriptional regulator, MarR family [Massilia sp. CF038]
MTTPLKPPLLVEHLCFNLYSTSLKMTQLYKPLLAELRLTYPQYLVMLVLWEEEGLGIRDVAMRLEQDSGSVTPIVKRLEAEGYLLRQRDPKDERNRVLTLTDAGRKLREAGGRLNQQIAQSCNLQTGEMQALMAGLSKLARNLEK